MIPVLRPYQTAAEADINAAWLAGYINIILVLATRAGKTVLFSKIIKDYKGVQVAIAHRQELIGQMSLTLARFGVKHNAIAPNKVIKFLVELHVKELGQSFYEPTALISVAGVDTLLSRKDKLTEWAKQVGRWVQDEAHHVLEENKWGRVAAMFPNAQGLGVTANTIRADGKGLGRHADGIFDKLIVSVGLYDLIQMGYATPYRIISPQTKDLDLDAVKISNRTGDYNRDQLVMATRKSSIIGDVVEHYKKFAVGKLGITFATDVETAGKISDQFNAAGVPAEVVSAKTPDRDRIKIQERFKNREILQMVNVDLFGEGYDVPAIEVVSMARATTSFNLFCQQFARGLTIMDSKKEAIILDHVGNCVRFSMTHGMPDSEIQWSLDRREARGRGKKNPDLIPQKSCLNPECLVVYEAIHKECPYCGFYPTPTARTGPEFVDGDLEELDFATLEKMRGRIKRVDTPANMMYGEFQRMQLTPLAVAGAVKKHRLKQNAIKILRDSIAWWAGHQKALGRTDSQSHRLFWFKFGIDSMNAQCLGRPAMEALTERINTDIFFKQGALK